MKPIVQKAVNDQIREEFYSAYLYLAMSAYFASRGFAGISKWMREQANEETGHAMKFLDFLNASGGEVVLDGIAKPPSDFHSVPKAFEASLEHEQFITARIHKLYELAEKEKAYSLKVLLHWFINEQMEEEGTVTEILQQIKIIGNEKSPAMLMLDHRLGKRGGQS